MKTLINFIQLQILGFFTSIFKRFVVYKYGNKSDICVLTGFKENKEKLLSFQTSHTGGIIKFDKEELASAARRYVGQNALTLYGLPDGGPVPNIVLYIAPSAITTIGLFNCIKFMRDWRGESKVGDIVVVTYTTR